MYLFSYVYLLSANFCNFLIYAPNTVVDTTPTTKIIAKAARLSRGEDVLDINSFCRLMILKKL